MNADRQRPPRQNPDRTGGVCGGGGDAHKQIEHRSQAHPDPGNRSSTDGDATDPSASPKPVPKPKTRPCIRIFGGSRSKNAYEAERHLRKANIPLFQSGSRLVRLVITEVPSKDGGRTKVAALEEVSETYLLDLMGRHITWLKPHKKIPGEWSIVDPPREVARALHARAGEWRFPVVAGIIRTPVMLPGGQILLTAGYDEKSGLILFDPPQMPPIPDHPTKQNAEAALAKLKGLLSEFPFKNDAAMSVALSALITPAVRPALSLAPMHVIRAPSPGTGKSYLVDLVSTIYAGAPCPVIGKGETDGELEKRLHSSLIAGHSLVNIDNVNGDLGGDFLCQAIERPLIDVRILRKSEQVRIINNVTLFATGNNLRLVGDLVRRSIVCTLDAETECPENRQFIHDPIALISPRRGEFIAAALTLVRAHQIARRDGLPAPPQIGSFSEWSGLVRGALIWLGCTDPLATMEAARANDPELEVLQNVIVAIAETFGVGKANAKTTAEIVGSENANLADAISGTNSQGKSVDAVSLGKWLARHVDRIIGKQKLMRISKGNRASLWYVADLTNSGDGGGV
jgi:putative DNA primase/helicase